MIKEKDEKAGMRNVKKLLDKRATDMAKVAKSCNSKSFPPGIVLNYQYQICVILYPSKIDEKKAEL